VIYVLGRICILLAGFREIEVFSIAKKTELSMVSSNDLISRSLTFILAGGQGQRLYPLTRDRAKPVVPFCGTFRLIDFTLSNCFNSGLHRINILTQHNCESLHSYVRSLTDRHPPGEDRGTESPQCLCPVPGKRYRGTADAVFHNLPIIKNANADFVVVLSGDHVYKMDYRDMLRFHVDSGSDATIAAIEYPRQAASQFGVLQINSAGYATGFEEKPRNPKPMFRKSTQSLISMGVYVFNARVLVDALSDDAQRSTSHDFGRDIIPGFIGNRQVSVYNYTEMGTRLGSYWRDVGTLDTYYNTQMELLLSPFFDAYDSAGWPVRGAGAQYPCGVQAIGTSAEVVDSLIPEGVSIEPGSRVIHSVLSPGVRIESSATVQNSILLGNVRVGVGAQVHRSILDEGVRIGNDAQVGSDLTYDCEYDFVTESGIVVIPGNAYVGPSQTPRPPRIRLTDFVTEDPFKTLQSRWR
jgi:glucose-1-phosphate adenylyltransferase